MEGSSYDTPIVLRHESPTRSNRCIDHTANPTGGTNHDANQGTYKARFFITIYDQDDPVRLHIPMSFSRVHGDDINDTCVMRTPDDTKYQVTVERDTWDRMVLTKGWSTITSQYELDFCNTAMFKYKGNANFDLRLFDITRTEIDYNQIKTTQHGRKSRTPILGNGPDGFTSPYPFFTVEITPASIKPGGQLWIPTLHKKEFLEDYESDVIQLMIGDITHDVKLVRTKKGYKMGNGWPKFADEGGVEANTTCVFELFNRMPITYLVHVYTPASRNI